MSRSQPPAYQPKLWRIALDFGTTFTGVAYCLPFTSVPGFQQGHIFRVGYWPAGKGSGGNGRSQPPDDVPSLIHYEEDDTKIGWEAHNVHDKPLHAQKSFVPIYQMKLGLDESDNTAHVREALRQSVDKLPCAKSVEDLITEYLAYVFMHTLKRLRLARFDARDKVELVFAVPSTWSPRATRTMYAAIDRASKVSGLRFGHVRRSVSEPEAAMAYVLEEEKSLELGNGDCFIICDAGGGTVDLGAYLLDGGRPREVVASNGGPCGSTYLDQRFRATLEADLVSIGLDVKRAKVRKAINQATSKWIRDVKHAHEPGDGNTHVDFYLPETHNQVLRKFDPASQNYLITKEIREIFEPVLSQLWTLLVDQIDRTHEQRYNIKRIIMVGGFSQSPYLQDYIINKCEAKGVTMPTFLPNCQEAIVKGAMIWANQGKYQANRVSRYSIGICQHMAYDPRAPHHRNLKPSLDEFDRKYAENCVSWMIKRGSEIPYDGIEGSFDLHIDVPIHFEAVELEQLIIISHTNDKDNYWIDDPINHDAEKLGTLSFKTKMSTIRPLLRVQHLPKPKKRQKSHSGSSEMDLTQYYRVQYRLTVKIEDLNLTYKVIRIGSSDHKQESVNVAFVYEPGTIIRENGVLR